MTTVGHIAIVAQAMAIEPIVIHEDATLTEAAALMDRHMVSGLPVVDHAGCLLGVISEADLVRARGTEYLWANWNGLAVRHLMTAPAITVRRSTTLRVAAREMEHNRVHRLVVVADDDPSLPIGVISTTDVVHAIAAEEAERHAG